MKGIPEFDRYLIDKDGVVYIMLRGSNDSRRPEAGLKVVKQHINKDGYKYVRLSKNGVRKNLRIHRLLGLLYIDNPQGLDTVNHIDFNRLNNNLSNLEWLSIGDNVRHSSTVGRYNKRGTK